MNKQEYKKIAEDYDNLVEPERAKIRTDMETLAMYLLENAGEYREYTDEDVQNATLIFAEVILARTNKKHRDKISNERMLELSNELGKSLYQTVETFTGVDLHKV